MVASVPKGQLFGLGFDNFNATGVPEPAHALLLVTGGLVLAGAGRLRRGARSQP